MTDGRVRCVIDGAVGHLSLVRPEAANTIDLQWAGEFEQAIARCAVSGVRALLVTSSGRQFCGGGDLREFAGQPDVGAHLDEVTARLHRGIAQMVEMDAPVVMAVQGPTAGAGIGLVCAADVVLAATSSSFVMAYTRLGLSPDGSASWFLPRLVGLRRAVELTITNRILSAEEALAWGLVSRVVPDEEVVAEARSMACSLAEGPTGSYGVSARLLRTSWDRSLRAHLDAEAAALVERAGTTDGLEGLRAFVEKRPPRFCGS